MFSSRNCDEYPKRLQDKQTDDEQNRCCNDFLFFYLANYFLISISSCTDPILSYRTVLLSLAATHKQTTRCAICTNCLCGCSSGMHPPPPFIIFVGQNLSCNSTTICTDYFITHTSAFLFMMTISPKEFDEDFDRFLDEDLVVVLQSSDEDSDFNDPRASSLNNESYSVSDDHRAESHTKNVAVLANKKKRKRKHVYRGLNAFPTITRTDYRRNYPIMWMNVINYNDAAIFRSLLEYSSVKNCIHYNEFNSSVSTLFPLLTHCSSRDLIVLHCAYKSHMMPDVSCRMNGCYIRRSKSFEGTQIIMDVTYRGTLLYEIKIPDPRIEELKAMEPDPKLLVARFSKVELPKYKVPIANPVHLEISGVLTITMDNNHSVTGFYSKNRSWISTPVDIQSHKI